MDQAVQFAEQMSSWSEECAFVKLDSHSIQEEFALPVLVYPTVSSSTEFAQSAPTISSITAIKAALAPLAKFSKAQSA